MITSTLELVVANPNYPGPGEYSTTKVEKTLNYDPNFEVFNNIPVDFNLPGEPTQTLTFEVRERNAAVTGSNTNVTYSMSAFGVLQPDGSTYGN